MLQATTYLLNTFFFFILFSLCVLVARSIVMSKRNETNSLKKLFELESQANSVRKKDISNLDYIYLPVDSLPMQSLIDCGEETLYNELNRLANEKILNLSEYSNTDLKLLYGPANLGELSQCDDNYTSLIRLLHKAGTVLDDDKASLAFLEYAVSIGSDISGTYEALGRLYLKYGNNSDFDRLLQSASKLTSISKDVTLSKLNNIKITGK